MRGVKFGDKHTWYDWGLALKSRPAIEPPTVKSKIISVEGSDKVIDLSETLTGAVKYGTRKITCEFYMICPRYNWDELYTEILNYLHGKRLNITFDDDPKYYYTGRVSVGVMSADKASASFKVTATADPYKHVVHGEGVKL